MKCDSSNFVCWLIYRSTNVSMIYCTREGCVQGQHDLVKFWQISDSISEIVQDKHIVATLTGNRMWPIEWHSYRWPLMTLKVTFAVSDLSISYSIYDVFTRFAKCTWLVIWTIFWKTMDITTPQPVTYTVNVALRWKRCQMALFLLHTINRKWYMTYWVTFKVIPTASLSNVIFTQATICYSSICCHCVSLRPSQVKVVANCWNLWSHKQCCTTVRDTSFMMQKISTKLQKNAGGVGENCTFWLVEKSVAQTPYHQQFVFIRHGHPRPWPCAGGSRIWWLRSSWRQQGWWYGSMLMTPTASHARCATVDWGVY